jgi:hypothetical protein
MKAEMVYRTKRVLSDDAILEMVIWRLPNPVPGSTHAYKYRLYFGKGGLRLVGYDNERGKGDHRHFGRSDLPYSFISPEQLVQDFLEDVRRWRER